jgi:hypothetical protein
VAQALAGPALLAALLTYSGTRAQAAGLPLAGTLAAVAGCGAAVAALTGVDPQAGIRAQRAHRGRAHPRSAKGQPARQVVTIFAPQS